MRSIARSANRAICPTCHENIRHTLRHKIQRLQQIRWASYSQLESPKEIFDKYVRKADKKFDQQVTLDERLHANDFFQRYNAFPLWVGEQWRQQPESKVPEVAFVGRSNVGKSSLLNMILNTKVCRTSNTPGATQTLRAYSVTGRKTNGGAGKGGEVDDKLALVDVPGYGYGSAKINVIALNQYFKSRRRLGKVFVCMDSRREPGTQDAFMMKILTQAQIPTQIILTKADKFDSKLSRARKDRIVDQWLERFEQRVKKFDAPAARDLKIIVTTFPGLFSSKNILVTGNERRVKGETTFLVDDVRHFVLDAAGLSGQAKLASKDKRLALGLGNELGQSQPEPSSEDVKAGQELLKNPKKSLKQSDESSGDQTKLAKEEPVETLSPLLETMLANALSDLTSNQASDFSTDSSSTKYTQAGSTTSEVDKFLSEGPLAEAKSGRSAHKSKTDTPTDSSISTNAKPPPRLKASIPSGFKAVGGLSELEATDTGPVSSLKASGGRRRVSPPAATTGARSSFRESGRSGFAAVGGLAELDALQSESKPSRLHLSNPRHLPASTPTSSLSTTLTKEPSSQFIRSPSTSSSSNDHKVVGGLAELEALHSAAPTPSKSKSRSRSGSGRGDGSRRRPHRPTSQMR